MSESKAGCADPERSAAKDSSICQSLKYVAGHLWSSAEAFRVTGHFYNTDPFHAPQKPFGHDAEVAHIVSNDYEAIPDDLVSPPAPPQPTNLQSQSS